jgi:hypothetical protein
MRISEMMGSEIGAAWIVGFNIKAAYLFLFKTDRWETKAACAMALDLSFCFFCE